MFIPRAVDTSVSRKLGSIDGAASVFRSKLKMPRILRNADFNVFTADRHFKVYLVG
jgi:hypothetical protein